MKLLQKPVPADKWESVKQCTKFSTGFPFIPPIPTSTPLNISEDSLYLNVMIPEAKEGQKVSLLKISNNYISVFKPLTNLPVFFYIHGLFLIHTYLKAKLT
jgi:carboxylesterase type B